ncbi:hypothetical protein PHLGIDRAFT_94879 [Phlebiopsis gigantea 11061_1 CR5-6]|uniref:Kinase n=1 Tax=Phlebiopsis gigantea (strain 11061_1 CR5-6) TaxID=745531 RepID=A0A0C3S1V8_PHLG1|nr:hypothetical protein PHLGIDRAFT_94879 [Phlebiopsis gigantea 11061_1 CR5-6]
MTNDDGSVIFKPALPAEVNFYQSVLSNPELEPLRPYIPRFYGTLRLEGQADQEQSIDGIIALKPGSAEAISDDEKDSIVLENLSCTFSKPNVLDIKLGTILYDESASEEKRARMEKTARETTSLETGVRLTGFSVYDLAKNAPVVAPKSYGKSIKAAQLPEGVARFFPVAHSTSQLLQVPSNSAAGTGLPPDVLLPILESLRDDISEIREALSNAQLRMVGASLLVVYEADVERAREGVKFWLSEDGEVDEDEGDEGDEGDEDEGEGSKKPGIPYNVKLIDFAHTRLVPGQGPDEGVLLGLSTVLRLLDGRMEVVKALL